MVKLIKKYSKLFTYSIFKGLRSNKSPFEMKKSYNNLSIMTNLNSIIGTLCICFLPFSAYAQKCTTDGICIDGHYGNGGPSSCWRYVYYAPGNGHPNYFEFTASQGTNYEFSSCFSLFNEQIGVAVNDFVSRITLEDVATGQLVMESSGISTCGSNQTTGYLDWLAHKNGTFRVYIFQNNSQAPTKHYAIGHRIKSHPPNSLFPNLVAFGKTGICNNVDLGGDLEIDFTVSNHAGSMNNKATKMGIYLSTNSTFDPSAQLLSRVDIPLLQTGECYSGSINAHISAITATNLGMNTPGNYVVEIFFKADDTNLLIETNESDNIGQAPNIQIGLPQNASQPDYHIQFLPVSFDPNVLGRMAVHFDVINGGPGDVSSVFTQWELYFSWDMLISSDDIILENNPQFSMHKYTSPLASGQQETASLAYVDWINFAYGGSSGYLIAKIDKSNCLPEADETNNIAAYPVTFPQVFQLPDFSPFQEPQDPFEFFRQQHWTYYGLLGQLGAIPYQGTTFASLSYSHNEYPDEGDIPLAQILLELSEEDVELPFELEGYLPEEVPLGPGYLILEIDPYQEVEEMDETNNILVHEVMIFEGEAPTERKTMKKWDESGLHFNLFPNPSTGNFEIQFPQQDVNKLQVYNLMGELIYFQKIIQDRAFQIDLSHQESGIYLVKLSGPTVEISTKVLLR